VVCSITWFQIHLQQVSISVCHRQRIWLSLTRLSAGGVQRLEVGSLSGIFITQWMIKSPNLTITIHGGWHLKMPAIK
ncbi:unnamed protein product, partial [Candidula unifasciata]